MNSIHTSINPKTLADLQWNKILQAFASHAETDLGREKCKKHPFFYQATQVREHLTQVEEFRQLVVEEQLTLPVGDICDIRQPIGLAAKGGVLEPCELLTCASVLHAATRVSNFLESRQQRMPRAYSISHRITDLSEIACRVEQAFDAHGELADHASPELARLRDKTRSLHRAVKHKLDQMLHDEQFIGFLRESYYTIRNERYVVPVLASSRSEVPGIVHNASQSGQTLFVEPQSLVSLGNELAIAQSMVQEEERRILQELSRQLGEYNWEIQCILESCAELDAFQAAALLALELCAEPPEIVPPGAPFRLLAMRHPLLALQQKNVVANDIGYASQEQVLVLSGPNAGGKTITLSGVGLCALMLRAGLPIPAERGSSLPLFEGIESAIGDAQDLYQDLSTFSAHLTALRDMGKQAGSNSLVLIDEIAGGTDPREGSAIALAVLDDLATKGAHVIVTTHLEELKSMALINRVYVNIRVGFDSQKMAPTYKLHLGMPGSSSAIEIARRVGLNPKVCAQAEENLQKTTGPLGLALKALETKQQEVELIKIALEEEKLQMQSAKEQLKEQQLALQRREKEIEAAVRQELFTEIEEKKKEVSSILASLQAQPSLRVAVKAQSRLAGMSKEEEKKLAKEKTQSTVSEDECLPEGTSIHQGMRVKIPFLGEAQVLEVSGKEALVVAGAMKLRQKLKDLIPLRGRPKPLPFAKKQEEKMAAAENAAPKAIKHNSQKIDVRGMRAEDARIAVETFFDRCYSEGTAIVEVVHGLGTGALKNSIRDYLQDSPYVRSFRSGANHEGGEAITIVALNV